MTEVCATVKIKTENGSVLINETDFDASIHELVVDEPKSEQVLTPIQNQGEPAAPVQKLVSKDGSKYYVVDVAGNRLIAEGFKTESDAWAAAIA